ncbi:MAG TPA: radical SAM protein [Pyrodictiaceae archaeon]|nr:radical SAM protein [Pyrodictiaceae archaeon]HIQ10643.1 radical SAM protein [Pyrodictium sp.]
MTERRRDPIVMLLTMLRLAFSIPVTRKILSYLDYRVDGEYVVDYVLRGLANEKVAGCRIAHFYTFFLKNLTKAFITLANLDYSVVEEALKDPAIRRGLALVIRGLARYGVTVPQKLPAPFLIVWNFTNMCNFRCAHCYQRAHLPLPTELSLKEKLNVVEQLDKAGVAAIALSGGEPTIHPHFFTVVREAAKRGMYVAVATNGWLMADEKFVKKMKEAGVRYVEVSIDSADPRKHDKFRGIPGAWKRATMAVRNAVKYGLHTAIATTITRYNIDEIEDMIELAEELGAHKIVFFNFIPVGRGTEIIDLDLDPLEREKILHKLFNENKRHRVTVLCTAPQYSRVSLQISSGKNIIPTHFYNPGVDTIIATLAEYIGGCGAGRIYAAIEPDGTVTPCVFMPIRVGNIREEHFTTIWEKSRTLNMLRNRELLRGACGKCPYRYICGGCRARAYAYTGDPLGPDPGCIYNAKVWEALTSKWEHVKEKVQKLSSTKPFAVKSGVWA